MILVVGATGALGSEVCRRLRTRGQDVRGLVRRGSAREASLRGIGVEVCTGDMRSRAELEAACSGVSAVISTATAMGSKDKTLTLRAIDRDAQLQLVDVAKAAGVKTFVYVSLAPHLTSDAPLVRYKREVEAAVRASGMQWTILQPCIFMEIWLSKDLGFDYKAGSAMIVGPGTAPLYWISVGDVAEHAVLSLTDPRLANRDLPLGGPEGLGQNDVARIFEKVSKRPFRTRHVPRQIMAVLGPVIGLVSEMAASGMSLMVQASYGDVIDASLQRKLALPLTTVQEYATRVTHAVAAGRAPVSTQTDK